MSFEPTKTDGELLSRREFIFSRSQLYSVLAVTGLSGGLALGTFTDFTDRLQRQGLRQRIVSESGENRRSAARTLLESVVIWAGNMTICNFLDRKGVQHGTHAVEGAAATEFMQEHPIRDYIHSNFTMPVLEEAVFRLLPSSFFTEERPDKIKFNWDVGLSANALFSVIHNFGSPEPGKFKFTLNSLPLEQFILGAYCWYAQRAGGFVHAAGAHILYNNLCSIYSAKEDFKQADDTD